jgi:magnesium transporter
MIVTEKIFESFKWIDIENPNKNDLEKITSQYHLNYYLIKDSLEKGHLPKYEKTYKLDFFIFRAYTSNVSLNIDEIGEMSNKIAFFILEDTLFTIHRANFNFLNIHEEKHIKIQELFLRIVGSMTETFSKPTQDLSSKITEIEKTIFLKDHRKVLLEELYFIKSQSRILKKVIHITQNVIEQVSEKYQHSYLYQDIKDQLLNQLTINEESVENANQLMTTYLSISDQKNNEVVRLLTIFSAFFLPLTFIAGVYGMNFDFMPELKWKYGYLYSLMFMLLIVVVIYIWFRRKRIF